MWDLSIIVLGIIRQTDRRLYLKRLTFNRMIMNVCCKDAGMKRLSFRFEYEYDF